MDNNNSLKNDSGFMMLEILLGIGLTFLLLQSTIQLAGLSAKAALKPQNAFSFAALQQAVSITTADPARCGCNVQAAATYQFPSAAALPLTIPMTAPISAWNQTCSAAGAKVVQAGDKLGGGLEVDSVNIVVTQMTQANQNWYGSINIKASNHNAVEGKALGSNNYDANVPILFSGSVAAGTATITGCLKTDQALIATRLRFNRPDGDTIRVSNVDGIGNIVVPISGIPRSNLLGTFQEDWDWTIPNAVDVAVNADLADRWYYFYAVPGAAPGSITWMASLNAPNLAPYGPTGQTSFTYLMAFFNADAGGGISDIRNFLNNGKKFTYINSLPVRGGNAPDAAGFSRVTNVSNFVPSTGDIILLGQVKRNATYGSPPAGGLADDVWVRFESYFGGAPTSINYDAHALTPGQIATVGPSLVPISDPAVRQIWAEGTDQNGAGPELVSYSINALGFEDQLAYSN